MTLAQSKRASELQRDINIWEENRLFRSGVVRAREVCKHCWRSPFYSYVVMDVPCMSADDATVHDVSPFHTGNATNKRQTRSAQTANPRTSCKQALHARCSHASMARTSTSQPLHAA